MTTLQLVSRTAQDRSLDLVPNPDALEPEEFAAANVQPFLSGSEDLLALAVAVREKGYTPSYVALVDRFLTPLDRDEQEVVGNELLALLRQGTFADVRQFVRSSENASFVVLSVELRDPDGGRVELRQDGVVSTQSDAQADRFPSVVRGLVPAWRTRLG